MHLHDTGGMYDHTWPAVAACSDRTDQWCSWILATMLTSFRTQRSCNPKGMDVEHLCMAMAR